MLKYLAAFLLLAWPLTVLPAESLIVGDPDRGKQKAESCAACHGPGGNSTNPAWPKLAGQQPDYLVTQLKAFKSGERQNAQMSPMAQDLSEQDMHDLAAYYARQTSTLGAAGDDAVETAETLYRAGKRDAGMPACIACHGPQGNGVPGAGYPKISGQHPEYTAAQLKAYRQGERSGGKAEMMETIAAELTDAEIEALAEYLGGLH